jgi:hexosaminidase
MFAVWNDHTGNGISSQDVYHRIFPAMQTLAVKMWDGKNATLSFAEFNRKRLFLSEAPGVNMLGRPARSARGIVFEISEPKQGKLLRQSLTDIGYNYRVTFDITAGNNQKGTVLFSSDYSVFYVTDPEEGKIGFSRDGYTYRFNYVLQPGKKVKMSIEGTNTATKLFVNDQLLETLAVEINKADIHQKDKRKYVQTLFFPLKMINKFNGSILYLRVEYLGEK